MNRRTLLAAVAACTIMGVSAPPSFATDYPRRPINIVVPFAAGGGADTYARALAAAADWVIGVPLVVVNREGSGGLNGARSVMHARPDGYTLMLTSGGSFLLSTLTRDTGVDALESFEFLGQIGDLTTSLMVPIESPFRTAQDLVDAAKARPGALRWAHAGRGGFHHVGGLGFLRKNGIAAQDVPFTGGGPARAALIGGQTDFAFLGIQQLAGFEGQLRALAVNAAERDAIMKDVPSFGELGLPFAAVSSPVVMVAPKGVPADVVAFVEAALKEIVAKPAFVDALVNSGTAPAYADARGAKAKLAAMRADAEPLVTDLRH